MYVADDKLAYAFVFNYYQPINHTLDLELHRWHPFYLNLKIGYLIPVVTRPRVLAVITFGSPKKALR